MHADGQLRSEDDRVLSATWDKKKRFNKSNQHLPYREITLLRNETLIVLVISDNLNYKDKIVKRSKTSFNHDIPIK